MSAIAGIIAKHGQPVDIEPALHHLKMYGDEDGSGVWKSQHATLAYQHRPVTYRSHDEQQPLQRGPYVIVADARIDNIDDLKAHKIDVDGPDSYIILNAYEKWGERCPEYLIGDYAFAIWNEEDQTLYCARDHIGARPFYYYDSQDVFVFMSDLRAIIALEEVPDEIDEHSVYNYLSSNFTFLRPSHRTFLKNIYKLTYGCNLKLNNAVSVKRYWYPESVAVLRFPNDANYIDALSELLEKAVRSRISSPFPVGSHLSGGIDSSVITVLAARHLQTKQRTLTAFPWLPEPEKDKLLSYDKSSDLKRIHAIADAENLDLQFINASDHMPHFDFATRPSKTLYLEWFVQKTALSRGIKTILSGWGGDESITFQGHKMPIGLLHTGKWHQLLLEILPKQSLPLNSKIKHITKAIWNEVFIHYLPINLQKKIHRGFPDKDPSERFISDILKSEFSGTNDGVNEFFRYSLDAKSWMYDFYYLGHLEQRMNSWSWSGAQHQVQYMYPLTDRRIMEFGYSIPINMHIRDGWNRYIIRKTSQGLLPNDILWGGMGTLKMQPYHNAFLKTRTDPTFYQDRYEKLSQLNFELPLLDVDRLVPLLRNPEDTNEPTDRLALLKCLHVIDMYFAWKSR